MQDCRPLFSLLKMASKSKKVKKSKASDKKEKSLQEKVFVDSVPYSEPEENDDQLLMRSLIEFENTGKCTWLHSPAPGVLRSNLPTVLHLPSDSQDTRLNVGLETQYDDFELRQPLITALMPGPASGKPNCYISNNEVHIIFLNISKSAQTRIQTWISIELYLLLPAARILLSIVITRKMLSNG